MMFRLARLPRARSLARLPSRGHANPHFLDRSRLVDPSHPAAKLAFRALPSFACPHFNLRALPHALLHQPADFVPINPLLATRLGHTKSSRTGRRTISLLFHTSKKATSKSCVIRRRLRTKITAAIRLVVDRSADADANLDLIARPLQENEHLVLQDWTYVMVPDLAAYKAPLPMLVGAVRKALLSVNHQANRLQSSWSATPKAQYGDGTRSACKVFNSRPRAPGRLYSIPHRPIFFPHEKSQTK